MENVNKIKSSFYLLKKKIKNEDFLKLTSHSYKSIFNILYKKKSKIENKIPIEDNKEKKNENKNSINKKNNNKLENKNEIK